MSTQPYAWTVIATVPENPDRMPLAAYGSRYRWADSQSAWLRKGLTTVWVPFDGGRYEKNRRVLTTPGECAAKTWPKEATAKAQATVARNCGFIVEVVPLFADDTDWKAKHDAIAAEYAILELDMDELQREVVRLRTQLGEERITVLKLMKEAEAMSLYGSHEWTH